MPTIYIAGSTSGCGTTAVATGLATLLAKHGQTVTLAKALRVDSSASQDVDSAFHHKIFPNNVTPTGWPISLKQLPPNRLLDEVASSLKATHLPQGITIVEGVSGDISDDDRNKIDATLARALNSQVILVSNDASSFKTQVYNGQIIGVIVNGVPVHSMHDAEMISAARAQQQGIPVLGLLPESRRMLSPSVSDVAAQLEAELINRAALNSPEIQLGELVEHFMLGGWFLDHGAYVFGRRENKAVIVRGDRPDLQMAALDTSTVCLVLTNGKLPVQYIVHHANLRQTPLLATQIDTLETMEKLNNIGDYVTSSSTHKAQYFAELLETCCDVESLIALATT
ncbi:MAG: DRTGG domain-containing protein [Chloroflexota bacterium]|nr:DRTGG domain-containing protein [Chloroflexota bacterium]